MSDGGGEVRYSWVSKIPAPGGRRCIQRRRPAEKHPIRRRPVMQVHVKAPHVILTLLREGAPVASKYEFIDEMRLDTAEYVYPVEFMCERLGVSRSGYYDWRGRPESVTSERRGELKLLIKKAFSMSDGTYGYRRVHAQLARWGRAAGPERVRLLVRELDLVPCQPGPKRFSLTQAAAGDVPDLVGRNFTAGAPGEKLVGDITYIKTGEGWLYLATVIDCCTKEVIGYAMDEHYQTPLISRAIRNAARNRKLAKDAIFHSDRGSNYMSAEFAVILKQFGLRRSTGRTGVCYD
ncbi:IS3 family transposase, partial [Streptomyces sp. 1222.5]|uniref:IS3 family transposase n=1 Tax=Streptomyces sp. 1222.5 TaxID=1881026 RepID=UPI003EB98458